MTKIRNSQGALKVTSNSPPNKLPTIKHQNHWSYPKSNTASLHVKNKHRNTWHIRANYPLTVHKRPSIMSFRIFLKKINIQWNMYQWKNIYKWPSGKRRETSPPTRSCTIPRFRNMFQNLKILWLRSLERLKTRLQTTVTILHHRILCRKPLIFIRSSYWEREKTDKFIWPFIN